MTYTEPICMKCKHFDWTTGTCPAFPNGTTPDEIVQGDNDHSKPLPDQFGDFVYEPKEKGE